jgi:AcrR family transcriptional regulator
MDKNLIDPVFMSNEEIRSKLLDAVIKLIGQKPSDKITIREIAKEAGTNSAAISYHFENKDRLIQEANKYYWEKLCIIFKKIIEDDNLTIDKVEQYSLRIMNFYFDSVGVLRTEQNGLINNDLDDDTSDRIHMQFKAIQYLIKFLKPEISDLELKIKTVRYFSSLAYPALWPEMYEKVIPSAMTLGELKMAYIKDLVDNI